MSGEAWLYLLAVIINAVNLFLQVFFTIMYSDLEWYSMSRIFCHGLGLTPCEQRLHQSYRSLQPLKYLHCTGGRGTRLFDNPVPR